MWKASDRETTKKTGPNKRCRNREQKRRKLRRWTKKMAKKMTNNDSGIERQSTVEVKMNLFVMTVMYDINVIVVILPTVNKRSVGKVCLDMKL